MALLGQVGHVHIVDNGSGPESTEPLRRLADLPGISVDYLPANRGIGHALNLGLARAREGGHGWLLTMDQDSRASAGMISAFCGAHDANPGCVCFTPTLVVNGHQETGSDREVAYAITSGNLVKLEVFDRIGPFNSEMFIDCVDFDFSLRLRGAGWNIRQVGAAILYHELGERHSAPGILGRFYTLHSPLRRYYMYRNFFLLARLHFLAFPGFIIKFAIAHLILLLLIPFFDKNPWVSYSAIGKGILDFTLGRFDGCTRSIG